MNDNTIQPSLSGYYDPTEATCRPAAYAWRSEEFPQYLREALQGMQREETRYGASTLSHEMGGLDCIYTTPKQDAHGGEYVGHQAIGNMLWREDSLWRVAARGCKAFPDQCMLSRGLVLPPAMAGLPADVYILVRKLGNGPAGCCRLALGLEWGVVATEPGEPELTGRSKAIHSSWATHDMSLTDFHRRAVGPGLVWESCNSSAAPAVALAPPPTLTQGTAVFFASTSGTSELPSSAVQPATAGGGAAAAAAAAGGGEGAAAAAAPVAGMPDVYACAPRGVRAGLQRVQRPGLLENFWGGLKKLVGGGAEHAHEPPTPTQHQQHFAYGVGDIVGMQWDGHGWVNLVRNGAVLARTRVWPEGQEQAATSATLQESVTQGGDTPLHWPSCLSFVVLSTAECEFEVVQHREVVDRQRRSGDGAFAQAYFEEYGPMPAHEGPMYPQAAMRTVCQ